MSDCMMKDRLLAHLMAYGQEHLLTFWDRLNAEQQALLADEIGRLDLPLIARLLTSEFDEHVRDLADRAHEPAALRLGDPKGRFSRADARQRGADALRAGHMAALVVAGGQGTRLGFDHPKGMYPIGPISGASLFQIHVEKVLAASRRYGVEIPLCVMTSPATHDETVEFFAENDRFGLPASALRIFCQGTMPAVEAGTGRILLESPHHIALSPDGHGGMLAAISRSGVLDDLQSRGIRQLFYFQVDNPLVDVCGAEFVGYHLLAGSEMTTQVVAKHDPLERVGNVVSVDGRLHVIEYSDLPEEVARRRNSDGSLEIWAGSIAVHVIDVSFLSRVAHQADALPFHRASKKVAYVDPSGKSVNPEKPNAVKFERFIFDLLPMAENAIVVEVNPAKAFAPLKNAAGAEKDTPESVRRQLIALHREWLSRAGARLADDVAVEISPLYALDEEEVIERIRPGTAVLEPTYFREA
ncbi:MAG: UDPGP type 1 family protein [Thermoguttaceae bacterium]|nr:UDPGP type 1 family protein [Thermoguttaceae bacterium]